MVNAELMQGNKQIDSIALVVDKNKKSHFKGMAILPDADINTIHVRFSAVSKIDDNRGSVTYPLVKIIRQPADDELHHKIDALIQKAKKYTGFNGSVLVAKEEKIIFSGEYGFADKDKRIPLNENHQFNAGSIAKELTTIAILQLAEQGMLSYDHVLHKYLPSLPEWGSVVTIEHIMTHTSGLPGIEWKDDIASSDVYEQIVRVDGLGFTPGKGFLYGNLNVVLRALIVEAITQQSFQSYLTNSVFGPAGMYESINPANFDQFNRAFVEKQDINAINGMTLFTTAYDLYKLELFIWHQSGIEPSSILHAVKGDTFSGQNQRARFDFGRFVANEKGDILWWEHDGSAHPDHHAIKYHDINNGYIIVLMSSDGNKSTLFDLRRKLSSMLSGDNGATPINWQFSYQLKNQGIDVALNGLIEKLSKDTRHVITEYELNKLGYSLLNSGYTQEAAKLFKINLTRHSQSGNAYDSYAESLIKLNKTKQALKVVEQGLTVANQNNELNIVESLLKMQSMLIDGR